MKHAELETLIAEMKKLSIEENVPFWKRVATDLEKPTRQRRTVNVSKVAAVVKKGEIAVVPGKVIGNEKVDCEIASYSWSDASKAQNNIMSLQELMKKNPKAAKCRIVG